MNDRISKLKSHLEFIPLARSGLCLERVCTSSGTTTLKIGDVSIEIERPPDGCETLVPVGHVDPNGEPQDVLRILRFMMQKDNLGQDIYLIGPPGPLRRSIVLKYCELVGRPVEYVSLSQDTTESDLKQRREISNGTARYVDCAAVRAAIMGSVLVLDGIEKAERNVMPLLNNLLENREMALEDGRFLVHPKRYDTLLQEHSPEEMKAWKLVRTSHRFRVIALGLPIPRYPGSALDPPFRSRFQARDVPSLRINQQLEVIMDQLTEHTDPLVPRQIVQASAVLDDLRHSDGSPATMAVPEFPQGFEQVVARFFSEFPLISPRAVADLVYPFPNLFDGTTDDRGAVVEKVFRRFSMQNRDVYLPNRPSTEQKVDALDGMPLCNYIVERVNSEFSNVEFRLEPLSAYSYEFLRNMKQVKTSINVHLGERVLQPHVAGFVETSTNKEQFSKMVQAHIAGDFCLVGEKGGGKSALVLYFAKRLGYNVEHIPLYKDITARSLLQRRTTHPNGDTDWENSSLVIAALTGRLAVLDGVEQMIPGTLATLQLLATEREARLPDGRRLLGEEQVQLLCKTHGITRDELIRDHGVLPIHPAFRMVALARPAGAKSGGSPTGTWKDWLGAEVASMFRFIFIQPPLVEEQKFMLRTLSPRVPVAQLEKLMVFASALRTSVAKDEMLSALLSAVSLRSMIRICRRISIEPDALHEAILRAALSRFLPPIVLETLFHLLKTSGIHTSTSPKDIEDHKIHVLEGDEAQGYKQSPLAIGVVKVGDVAVDILPPKDVLLIPDILFYDNPRQALSMQEMIKDWIAGQHLLLIGNQGVGKNKLADRMLQLLRLPREYIQLHRDTTVQNLTSNPTIVNGVLKYEDSPLVRAAREGRVLVVDEADKAPTHVTAILKALVEDRSMLLSDGRRILDPENITNDTDGIPLHPDFRLIALANRPGFPFHGNDFFREVGDVFSCHAIDNPDANSEMYLLKQYGPDVPEDTLRKLIAAFDQLRSMSDDGQLSYPYSTRELTAIVKHMQRYPNDGVDRILRNVFDFDNYSLEEKQLLMDVFSSNGVPFSIGSSSFHVNTGRTRALPPPKLIESWSIAPRHQTTKIRCVMTKLTDVLRLNQMSRDYMWEMKPPHMQVNLAKNERGPTVFTEELYNFHLPQGLILGVTVLENGSMVAAARSHSFMMFEVDRLHERCTVSDIHAALPSDGTYRVSPATANVFSMYGAPTFGEKHKGTFSCLVQNPVNGNMIAFDLINRVFTFLDLPPGCSRSGPKVQIIQSPDCDQFLLYQRDHRYLTVINYAKNVVFSTTLFEENPPREQLPFGIERVQALNQNTWLVTTSDGLVRYLKFDHNRLELIFERLDRQEPSPEKRSVETLPFFASSSNLEEAPGALDGAGYTTRMVQLKPNDGAPGERIPGFAVNLPDAFQQGSYANIFQLDEQLVVGESGTEAEEDTTTKQKSARTHAIQLRKSDMMAVLRESPEQMTVNIELYDVNNAKRRTLCVSMEDDVLNNDDPDLRIRGGGAKIDSVHGGDVRHSPNLAKLTKSLTPSQLNLFAMRRTTIGEASQRMFVAEISDKAICTIDCLGYSKVWLVNDIAIREAFSDWRKLVGRAEDAPLQIIFEDEDGSGKGEGSGKGDGEGEGNGNGKGEGEGEGEGSGGGDGGGEGQLSSKSGDGSRSGKAKGKHLDQISELPDPSDAQFQQIDNPSAIENRNDAEEQVPEQVKEVAKSLKREEWLKLLKQLEMTEVDAEKYERYKEAVKTEIRELRVTLEGLEATEHERVWLKNQSTGDIDDSRLIDGLTGERAIYKRRADQSPDASMFQPLPKRMHFVFDLSMSMSRYAADGRLQRSLEAAVMVLEAVKGFEHKFDIKFTGHSGDSDNVPLVEFGKFPKNDKERLAVIKMMHAHTEITDSGDSTLGAMKRAIETITRGEADEYFTFLISDANLDQYSITPRHFQRLFDIDRRVHTFVLFIASMGDQAKSFEDRLPGKVFTCLDKTSIPKTLKKMFLAAASTTSSL